MVSRKRLSDGKIAQQSKYRAAIPISQAVRVTSSTKNRV